MSNLKKTMKIKVLMNNLDLYKIFLFLMLRKVFVYSSRIQERNQFKIYGSKS